MANKKATYSSSLISRSRVQGISIYKLWNNMDNKFIKGNWNLQRKPRDTGPLHRQQLHCINSKKSSITSKNKAHWNRYSHSSQQDHGKKFISKQGRYKDECSRSFHKAGCWDTLQNTDNTTWNEEHTLRRSDQKEQRSKKKGNINLCSPITSRQNPRHPTDTADKFQKLTLHPSFKTIFQK